MGTAAPSSPAPGPRPPVAGHRPPVARRPARRGSSDRVDLAECRCRGHQSKGIVNPGGEPHGGHRYEEDHGRRGPGMGTVAVAAAGGLAAGVVGGMVAAEVVDEIGDAFEDEEE